MRGKKPRIAARASSGVPEVRRWRERTGVGTDLGKLLAPGTKKSSAKKEKRDQQRQRCQKNSKERRKEKGKSNDLLGGQTRERRGKKRKGGAASTPDVKYTGEKVTSRP